MIALSARAALAARVAFAVVLLTGVSACNTTGPTEVPFAWMGGSRAEAPPARAAAAASDDDTTGSITVAQADAKADTKPDAKPDGKDAAKDGAKDSAKNSAKPAAGRKPSTAARAKSKDDEDDGEPLDRYRISGQCWMKADKMSGTLEKKADFVDKCVNERMKGVQ